ncbi:FAD-dependent oxidoreductase [Allostreptomyces psammosilenae]|uniref:Assimilatory nitrate reductase electron transfer subunit n=1 Tax=Allostreptomyces psammosilenae TaxID=1892865 RepID=A0A852ZVS1_9ACTN|nr:FAD-dependent oxidoreductase [Allostreptomyces psammosilenae]NYI05350.1 assimilatory nitrate reductase electron transfer subunit [Allostreptomyces psammosilenae]
MTVRQFPRHGRLSHQVTPPAPAARPEPVRVVVVGNGMVGARLAEEVRRRDPFAASVQLTVVGAEPGPAYNRVLLPSVVAGTMAEDDIALHPEDWARTHHTDVRTGVAAVSIDRTARTVTCDDGQTLRYDTLVLATGANAIVPPVPGVRAADGTPGEGVTVLRTLDDCRRLAALVDRAAAEHGGIAVMGGGVLGLEAARALASRGVPVTVVHPAGHVMDRQLDPGAGRVLARSLERVGVRLRLGALATAWDAARGVLTLDDGHELHCTGVLLSTGAAPETRLASEAGLRVEGGIVIDDRLATSDPAVAAIGDCARHPDSPPGLVQPGWEQAAVLADRLTGTDPKARYRGSSPVTRLKAKGIDLACLGDPHAEDDGEYEVVRLEDPSRERYAKLVLRDDQVTGAIMLGVPDAAAGLVQLYDRGAPAPADRLALLLGRALPAGAAGADSPAQMDDSALVCRCNTVTKAALCAAWKAGETSADQLCSATRAATGCGGCRPAVEKIAAWLAETDGTDATPTPSTSGNDADDDAPNHPAAPVPVPAIAGGFA